MKLTKLLFALTLIIFITSCSDSDDPTPSNSEIIGSWNMIGFEYEGTTTTEISGVSFTTSFEGVGIDMDLTLEFLQENSAYNTNGDYGIELTTTFQGQSVSTTAYNNGFVGSGTWAVDGNTISVDNGSGISQDMQIIELSGTTLKIGYTFSGAGLPADIEGTYTFERL